MFLFTRTAFLNSTLSFLFLPPGYFVYIAVKLIVSLCVLLCMCVNE